jgi:branched-chain amino acid transport system substrate-binding protein
MDDACEPKQAVAVANKIVSQKIKYVIGHVCSGSTIPASDIYENEGIVMVTPSATAPQLTEGKKRHFIFRTIGRDDQQGPAAAHYIINNVKPKKVAILHDKQSYGQGIASSVKKDLEAAKIRRAVRRHQRRRFGLLGGHHEAEVARRRFRLLRRLPPGNGPAAAPGARAGREGHVHGPRRRGQQGRDAIAGPASEGMLVTLPADFSADPANAAS